MSKSGALWKVRAASSAPLRERERERKEMTDVEEKAKLRKEARICGERRDASVCQRCFRCTPGDFNLS